MNSSYPSYVIYVLSKQLMFGRFVFLDETLVDAHALVFCRLFRVQQLVFVPGVMLEVHSAIRSRIGLVNQIVDGFSWILLRCFHYDLKFLSAAKFAFKTECNSKLAVAMSLMEECFVSMVDPRTCIYMIPHVLYNWR